VLVTLEVARDVAQIFCPPLVEPREKLAGKPRVWKTVLRLARGNRTHALLTVGIDPLWPSWLWRVRREGLAAVKQRCPICVVIREVGWREEGTDFGGAVEAAALKIALGFGSAAAGSVCRAGRAARPITRSGHPRLRALGPFVARREPLSIASAFRARGGSTSLATFGGPLRYRAGERSRSLPERRRSSMPDGHDAQRSPRRSSGGERKRAPSGVRNGSRDDASAKAQKSYERYIALAHDAAAAGDPVEMENCYQYAEHFLQVMKERTAQGVVSDKVKKARGRSMRD
jgi:Domain of unknown function (DUF4167)